ncbi:MAG: Gfo/Idh/MocA family oxidoreductase [Myxococcales bacterium]|nr:Gfo/Idh/MocA family oxidoreductase [Myxococcales bacterium]
MSKNFALMGAAGYVASRHLQAIKDTGNELLAACDPNDSVGVLDQYFLDTKYFTEVERFDRHLEKLKRRSTTERTHFVSICTPNYLHDAHVRLALRVGADAICEKPLVINPWNLDQLAEMERENEGRVYTTLQLRYLPSMIELKKKLSNSTKRADIQLSYIARRGPWYQISWKGDEAKSGGLALNIGVHFFDLLLWLFGAVESSEIHLREAERWSGAIQLKNADVRWYLSTRPADLPEASRLAGKTAYRSLTIDGEELEFSHGFTDLHTRVYEGILAGEGLGVESARPSVELVYGLRKATVKVPLGNAHPMFFAR